MKLLNILLLAAILTLVKSANLNLFTLELDNAQTPGFAYQFEPFKTSSYADDAVVDTYNAITFTQLTYYEGIITKDWITSPNCSYYFSIWYKGEADKFTGAFIGYQRSDQAQQQFSLGFDGEYYMDVYQQFQMKSTGAWNNYFAYVELPEGVSLKLIIEQSNYMKTDFTVFDAYFRGITVSNLGFSTDCPGADIQMKLAYYTEFFMSNNLEQFIFSDPTSFEMSTFNANQGLGKFVLEYLDSPVPCIKTKLYAFDENTDVISDSIFSYNHKKVTKGLVDYDTFEWIFNAQQIKDLNCPSQAATCTVQNVYQSCIKYTCPVGLHFYLDQGSATTFATTNLLYQYTRNNSQAIFNSSFSVVINEQTQTVVSTLVKTREVNAICNGICELNMDVSLLLKVKVNGVFVVPSGQLTIIWGDFLEFEITSIPNSYYLSLMEIVVTTTSGSESLDSVYINQFIQVVSSTQGRLVFKMRIHGEAGLDQGKSFNLKFLTKTSTTPTLRILEDSSKKTILAQISSDINLIAEEKKTEDESNQNEPEKENLDAEEEEISANHLILSCLALLLIFLW